MTLIFDDENLRKIAAAVVKLNPSATGYTIDAMCTKMRNVACEYAAEWRNEPGYVATGGYMLTAYRPRFDRENVHVKASLADHCIPEEWFTAPTYTDAGERL